MPTGKQSHNCATLQTMKNYNEIQHFFTHSLLELIAKELEQNTAWRKIRNGEPCNTCLFQYLCPPISNYELIFKRQNLCSLYSNI